MVIPHLHFTGNCREAISFYEQVFNTKVETIILNREYSAECQDDGVAHAVMNIYGCKVFLNDRFGNKENSTDIAIHLIIMFPNKEIFLTCYDKIKDNCIIIDPLETLPYSELSVQFIDKFGVHWGFMIEN